MQKEMTLREKAQKLYEYAFTIVWTDAMTSGDRAFYTTLRHNRKFIEAERRMYKPNQDTLYSFLPIQLEHTPYILEIPELEDKSRYLLVNILNLKTEMVLTKGTKNEKNGAGKYIILYRDAEIPEAYKDYIPVRSEDSRNYFIIRLESYGEKDYKTANAIQDQFVMRALYPDRIRERPALPADYNGQSSFMTEMKPDEFIKRLLGTLADTRHDDQMLGYMRDLKLTDADVTYDSLPPQLQEEIRAGFADGLQAILNYTGTEGYESNGWHAYIDSVGDYGKKYRYRAYINYFAVMPNLYTDTIYPNLETDSNGNKLDSRKTYRLHFKKGGLPQAKYFWSVILSGSPSEQLVINPYKKYLINSHGLRDFCFNADGSLDVIIGPKKPEDERCFANWIPSPYEEDSFTLLMRIYGPSEELLEKKWEFPTVLPIE